MLYEFKSKAGGTVVMTQPVAEQLLGIIGKAPAPAGVFEPTHLPEAVRKLQAAVDAEAPPTPEDDDAHEAAQRARYERRRAVLLAALCAAGFTVEHSEAGLYLWATRDEPCRDTVDWLARRGILVAPGDFYGSAGTRHVRIAMTATDERVQAAAERLRL